MQLNYRPTHRYCGYLDTVDTLPPLSGCLGFREQAIVAQALQQYLVASTFIFIFSIGVTRSYVPTCHLTPDDTCDILPVAWEMSRSWTWVTYPRSPPVVLCRIPPLAPTGLAWQTKNKLPLINELPVPQAINA